MFAFVCLCLCQSVSLSVSMFVRVCLYVQERKIVWHEVKEVCLFYDQHFSCLTAHAGVTLRGSVRLLVRRELGGDMCRRNN